MPSRRYIALRARIAELNTRLVPKIGALSPRPLTAREADLMRGFRVLVHAELESFLEDWAIAIADKAIQNYMATNKAGLCLVSLMSFSPLTAQPPPPGINRLNPLNHLTRANHVVAHFKTHVKKHNNGIKEVNLLDLLYPVGIVDSDLDQTLVNTLNSYGSDRGAVAHSSGRTQQPIDPVNELATVTLLMTELRKLDASLNKLFTKHT